MGGVEREQRFAPFSANEEYPQLLGKRDAPNLSLTMQAQSASQGEGALSAGIAGNAPRTAAVRWARSFLLPLLVAGILLINYRDPISLFLVSGVLAALALFISQKLPPLWGSALLAGGAAVGFAAGPLVNGLIAAAALALAAAYPMLRSRLRGEDDHFYLAPLFLYAFLGGGLALVWLFDSAAAQANLSQIAEYWGKQMAEARAIIGTNARLEALPGDAGDIQGWIDSYQGPVFLAFMLFSQAIIAYLAMKWVRHGFGWSDPVWGQFMVFRVKPVYALILIAGLALLVFAPAGKAMGLRAAAIPLLGWFSAGCLLAGIAFVRFFILAFHLKGRVAAARICQIGVIAAVLLAPWFFVLTAFLTGLLDIWFDVRRLAITKKILLGKGDS